MSFDYKKGYKEFYVPPRKPGIIEIPAMNYIAVRGKGNPNEEDSEYKQAIGLLYAIAFTIKMSYKGGHKIDGYVSYVVPPLEGLWWQDSVEGIDYGHKEKFQWIAMIRLPEFVTKEEFEWAVGEATMKKKQDFSKVEFFTYEEGLCVQCMHIGVYDDEPATIQAMNQYAQENGYVIDICAGADTQCQKAGIGDGHMDDVCAAGSNHRRYHHEIYLSDPRRTAPEKLKTVIRHPVKPVQER